MNTERVEKKRECLETLKFMLSNMHTKISVEGLVVFSEQSQNNSYFFRFENEKKHKTKRVGKKIPLRA